MNKLAGRNAGGREPGKPVAEANLGEKRAVRLLEDVPGDDDEVDALGQRERAGGGLARGVQAEQKGSVSAEDEPDDGDAAAEEFGHYPIACGQG